MHLVKESEYALVSLRYLASQPQGAIVPLVQIARANGLPPAFLAKTLRKLVACGLLASHRGRRRGYRLAREPQRITVREILEGIEGPDLFARCAFWGNGCSDRAPCPLHSLWASLRPWIAARMADTTLAALSSPAAFERRFECQSVDHQQKEGGGR
ncbi:MAG: Rrf2 family transcriptional regulator [Armatimonadota bacterium]|nr:Rrf2 family transcriptional regulator [Armatimonadota bacterium]